MIGTTLGDRYEILEAVGEGGMGTVYKARHKLIDKIIAVKVLQVRGQDQEISMARFHREAKAASNLNHPNLVAVNDFGVTADNRPFIIMEYVDGKSLSDVLNAHGPLSIRRFVRLFVQIASGLAHAHSKGVVHRDLKPNNIMIIDEGNLNECAKIVDFGIAKPIALDESAKEMTLTKTGTVFGSPPYMSPEQCHGQKVDQRSDIYSLGCTMYECLTGKPPFVSDSFLKTIVMHSKDKPKPLSAARPDLEFSPKLESLIERCLLKSPDERYQSMAEVIEALDDSQSVKRETEQSARKKTAFVGAGALILALIVFLVAYAYTNSINQRPAAPSDTVVGFEQGLRQDEITKQIDKSFNLAGEACARMEYDRACQLYQQALAQFEEMKTGDPQKHFQILFCLGDAQRYARHWSDSAASFDRAIEIRKKMGLVSDIEMADTLLRRGIVDYSTRHYGSAKTYWIESLRIKQSIEGKSSPGVAEVGSWLAEAYRVDTPPDYEKAIQIFRLAEKAYKRSAYFEEPIHAEVFIRLMKGEGLSLKALHRYKELETRMTEALKDINSLATADHPYRKILLEYKTGIKQLLADALEKQGKSKEAKKVRHGSIDPSGTINFSPGSHKQSIAKTGEPNHSLTI